MATDDFVVIPLSCVFFPSHIMLKTRCRNVLFLYPQALGTTVVPETDAEFREQSLFFSVIKEWRISLWWLIKSHLPSIWLCVGLCNVTLHEGRLNQTSENSENFEKLITFQILLFWILHVFEFSDVQLNLISHGMNLNLCKITGFNSLK